MEYKYPQLMDRVKATFADLFIVISFLAIVGYLFQTNGMADSSVKKYIIIITVFFYEPLLVSLMGGTLGHIMMQLRVVDEDNPQQKINFFRAFFRFVLKTIMGWISFLTVTSDEKKRAIHDKAVGAVVLLKAK